MIVNGTHTGTGAITVNEGATLCGLGKVSGKVTVNAGGMLAVGDTLFNRSDVFTVSGGATIKAGAIVQVSLSRPILMNHASKIKFGGATTIKDAILQLDMTNIATDLTANSSFTIFDIASATSFKGNFKEIIPAVPAEGFVWDTSSLFTNGKIYVRKSDNSVVLEETDIVKVSDLVDDELYIEVPTSARVTIYSASGSKMEVRDLEKLGMTWNVAKYPSGMYIVAIEMEGKHQTHRFLKR